MDAPHGAVVVGGFRPVVLPVLNGPPRPSGRLSDPDEGLNRVTALMQYTAQFNVTGQPAISLPMSWTDDGLPIGVQFVAWSVARTSSSDSRRARDGAHWPARVPPVHA